MGICSHAVCKRGSRNCFVFSHANGSVEVDLNIDWGALPVIAGPAFETHPPVLARD